MEIAEEDHSPEPVPSLIKHISTDGVADFDTIDRSYGLSDQPTRSIYELSSALVRPLPPIESGRVQSSVSISMPPTPTGRRVKGAKRGLLGDHDPDSLTNNANDTPRSAPPETTTTRERGFYSHQMPKRAFYVQPDSHDDVNFSESRQPRFGIDATKSRLQRSHRIIGGSALSADRYFDALQGADLDTLKPNEESVLPDDKSWPFLLRYTVSTFGVCLGVSSQAILWKALATSESTEFLHISLRVNLVLWIISVVLLVVIATTYLLKVIFYMEAVRREYYHPIRVNFFFAPWIALLFLCLGVPPTIVKTLPRPLWFVLMTPIFILELKIYGQWMSGGRRRLSKVANPANHLSVVGNFVGALLGATMGLKEAPLFFFAIGVAHYIVLFVTLYQRLPTNQTLPIDLHPVFFLFVAGPSVASMAWARIQGSFDNGSRIAYFISIFLYLSLAVRVNFFRGFKFSLTWWAYTFPMTGAAIATIRYSNEVRGWFTQVLAVALCAVSVLIVTALLVTTIIHAFVLRDLYPNDISIAITETPPRKRWFHEETGSPHPDDIENFFRALTSHGKAMEPPPSSDNAIEETRSSDDHN